MKRQGFGKGRRLTGRKAFGRVFGKRVSCADGNVVVYAAPGEADRRRLGLSVSRKHGGAVVRNRIKRLLREAFRLEAEGIPIGYDFVCVARVGGEARLEAYRRSIRSVCRRAAARVT